MSNEEVGFHRSTAHDALRGDQDFTEEWIPVSELEVDPEVQRHHLDYKKIERIKKYFNPGAVGLITVSRRNRVTNIVLDGMHRKTVVTELTDGTGKMLARVFTGLTRAEEAQMFLDLNYGNQPNVLDKFRMRIIAGDEVAIQIAEIVQGYGWTIAYANTNGHLQAVKSLERIYTTSVRQEKDPNILQLTIMVVTRAWGLERQGAQAVILDGLAAFLSEHGSNVDLDSLSKRLKNYKGGPHAFHVNAQALAGLKTIRVSMAVADLLTDLYNSGRAARSALPPWRRRS